MKPLSTHRITQFIAAAALAGISIVSAYAAPNYITPADSPIDTSTITTAGGSVSTPLNNFNTYLSAIQTQLNSNAVTGDTVRTPNFGVGGVAVKAADFAAAVGAAVANPANLGNEVAIVSAAVQYMPTNVKNILKAAATANAANAPAFVAAAAQVYPIGAASAAAGAIAGLIASSASGANNILMDDAAAAAAIATTRDLIANVAKQAVLATKLAKIGVVPVADGANRAKEVAAGLMNQFLTVVGTAGSNAALYLDDVGRGAASGAAAFSSVDLTKSDIAVAMIKEFALHGHSALNTEHNVVNFAMGAVKSALSGVTPSANSAEGVASALQAETTVGLAHAAEIEVGSRVQLAVRNGVADQVGAFNTALTPADYAHIYAALSGAVQGSPGKAGLFVTAAFDTANAPAGAAFTLNMKKEIVRGAVTGNFGTVGKVVTNSIAAAGGLSAVDAIGAAIPSATDQQAGLATLAAMKNNGVPFATPAEAVAVLNSALTAAGTAGYTRAFSDIALSGAKAYKTFDNELVAAAIAHTLVSGWEEGVAAYIIANNPKDVFPNAGANNRASAIAAATAKEGGVAGALTASVTLALDLTIRGKASALTIFDDALSSLHGNTLSAVGVVPGTASSGADKPRAVIFAVGALKNTIAIPVLAAALRLKSTSGDNAALLDYTISLNKKAEANIRLAYGAAVDVIAHPDNIFDVTDHKILTNPKAALEIASAVFAARPEYAHYAVKAALFRAPALAGKIASAAIQFSDMRRVDTNNPAAVAAISAAAVLGVNDGTVLKTTTVREALLKATIMGLVTAASKFPNNYGPLGVDDKQGLQGAMVDFPEATGAGSTLGDVTLKRAKATAAVLTGGIAQLQAEGATVLNNFSIAALTAAGMAMKTHGFAFAQAAGAAAEAVAKAGMGAPSFVGFGLIGTTLAAATGLNAANLENAARVGAAQYDAMIYGAGADGILNYAHHSGLNAPVTSIFNF